MDHQEPHNGEPEKIQSPEESSIPARPLNPVTATERIPSIDVLRGFAVLGILVINISMFSLPGGAQNSPAVSGGSSLADIIVWAISQTFFYQKFLTIFAALFGAGMILMWRRAGEDNPTFGKVYYRRLRWLLVIGLVHAYLLWWGDILFSYALCGMMVYPFRRLSPRRLVVVGSLLMLVALLIMGGLWAGMDYLRGTAMEAQAVLDAGETPTPDQAQILNIWEGVEVGIEPTEIILTQQTKAYLGGFGDVFAARASEAIMAQTAIFLMYAIWRAGGLMLIGMAFLKLGFFSSDRDRRYYLKFILVGYLVGLPLASYGTYSLIASGYDPLQMMLVMGVIDYIGSAFMALGHAGLIMLICRLGIWAGLRDRLAAVGRMALSNYLFHTVVFTTMFYGYGFGLFSRIDRFGLGLLVIAMWILQLILSPIWLRYYRFGPVEWLWRSLTYRRRQPMKVVADASP